MNWSTEDFDFRSILKDILKNIWVIFMAGAAVFLGLSGFYSLHYVPRYTSAATLAVTMKGNNGAGYASLQSSKNLVEVFKEVFQSDALRKEISKDLQRDSIDGTIQIDIIQETNLMNLKVTADTPKNAYLIIQSAMKNYDMISDYLFSNAKLEILKAPSIPYSPSNMVQTDKQKKIGAILGAGAVTIIIAVISFMRPTVKNRRNAKRQLDGRILGVIPFVQKYTSRKDLMKKLFHIRMQNRSVLISSVMLGMPFVESIKKVSTSLMHHMDRHKSKIIVISSVEENEGKSSIVANLALSLAEKGKRILLVDGDLKKPALHQIFEQDGSKGLSITSFIQNEVRFSDVAAELSPNLFIVNQFHGVSNSSVYLSSKKMQLLLQTGKEQFDYVIVDTPPLAVSTDAEILFQYAESAALVVRQDWAETGSINDAADTIRQFPCSFAGFILNAFRSLFSENQSESGYEYHDARPENRSVRQEDYQ